MPATIWLISWNCENQAPTDAMLDELLINEINNQLQPNQRPDFIVVGLQEAGLNSTFDRKFVSERLAKHKRLGTEYSHVVSAYSMGMTKGNKNYLQLGVLFRGNHQVSLSNVQKGTFRHSGLAFMEGKGGAFVKLTYTNAQKLNNLPNNRINLGFINAHLDSKNANRREEEIAGLLRGITGLPANSTPAQIRAALQAQFYAVFFMGDLNYRLQTYPTLQGNAVYNALRPAAMLQGNANFAALQGLGATTTVQTLTDWLADPVRRSYLTNLDSLLTSSLVNPQAYAFTFPPVDRILPTYKRYYQDTTANNPCRQLSLENLAQAPSSENTKLVRKERLRLCYFHDQAMTDQVIFNANRNAFDMGWLDRIGYATAPNQQVQAIPPANPLQLEDKNSLVLSDHTPVLLKVQVG